MTQNASGEPLTDDSAQLLQQFEAEKADLIKARDEAVNQAQVFA